MTTIFTESLASLCRWQIGVEKACVGPRFILDFLSLDRGRRRHRHLHHRVLAVIIFMFKSINSLRIKSFLVINRSAMETWFPTGDPREQFAPSHSYVKRFI